MALIDLKSDLSKFRKEFTTTPLSDKINASIYNIDDVPTKHGNDPNQSDLALKPYTTKLPTKNSRFDQGIVSIDNQLGTGSPFPDYVDANGIKIYDWKPTKHTGFTEKNKYSIAAGKKGFLEATYTTNSPIDDAYKKFNLQDESYNYSYIKHPLITRGIQRKGNEKPNRWGVDGLVNFDDGLIQGGITTVVDRTVADTVRIAKWMASPKGLLWVVKQVGLGLSNPNVEKSAASTLLGIQQTKVHTGLASLLSVPGTPFGLHFTRHGIPFKNELSSYEQVIKTQITVNTLESVNLAAPGFNRLFKLKKELFGSSIPPTGPTGIFNNIQNVLRTVNGWTGAPIVTLSSAGIGGPGSVYGIGSTIIRRYVNTRTDSISNAATSDFIQRYNFEKHYFPLYRADTGNPNDTSTDKSDPKQTIRQFESDNSNSMAKQLKFKSSFSSDGNIVDDDISTSETRAAKSKYTGAPKTGINSYITLAYGNIPKSDPNRQIPRDFRSDINETTNYSDGNLAGNLGTGLNKDYYKNNNLENKYGFGRLGALNADPEVAGRLTPTGPESFLVKGLDFSRTKNRKALIETSKFRGDKVNALDISSGTSRLATENIYPKGAEDLIKFFFEDGDQGYNVMPFRCTITGLSDSFSPGWDRIDIMGRPDGAYLYSSFERSISFGFMVAALSRSEMIPMWRKLNYLASYTMPDFNAAGAKPSGPFMRITIGDMFQRTPGFIESLTYTIPDDATWDIADDAQDNKDAKQLPMLVEASVTFKIVADFRPQMMGRVYSLSPKGSKDKTLAGQWLSDAEVS